MADEKPITRVVRNNWGSWDALRTNTKKLIAAARKNNGEIGGKQFNKELMGSLRMSQDEYTLALQAIRIAIDGVYKEEQEEQEREAQREAEQEQRAKERMIESARRQEWREIKRAGSEEDHRRAIFR